MHKKHPRTLAVVHASAPRVLASSTRPCALPTVRTLLALSASLLAGGAVTIACKGGDGITSDRDQKGGQLGAASAPASVSCSASEHVEPHIAPSPDNMQLGGKPMPVKTKGSGSEPLY